MVKYLALILILASCSPKGHVYRVHPLEGANYPKGTVKPKTVAILTILTFVAISPLIMVYETDKKPF